MNAYVDQFCWCALQVTLFAIFGLAVYVLLRRRNPLKSLLPIQCIFIIAGITLLTSVPWQGWQWFQAWQTQNVATVKISSPEIHSTPAIDLETVFEQPTNRGLTDTVELSLPTTISSELSSASTFQDFEFSRWKQPFALLAAIVCLVALLRLLVAIRELLVLARTSTSIEDVTVQKMSSELQTRFQLSQTVSLRESTRCEMPATIGWRRPIVLLPIAWRDWSPAQLRAVLAHELAHVQHHDFSTWLAVQVPLLLHSYHPLVHWLAQRVRWEQELAADRLAVAALGDRQGYLAALAELALGQSDRRIFFANISLAPTSSLLLGRLKMLGQRDFQASNATPKFQRAVLVATFVFAGLVVSGFRGNQSTAIADESLQPTISQTDSVSSPASEANLEQNSISSNSPADAREEIVISAVLKVIPAEDSSNRSPLIRQQESAIVLNTHAALLRSSSTLKAVIARDRESDSSLLKTKEDRLEWLSKNLNVKASPESNLLSIKLYGCPKEEIANGKKLVDAIILVYQHEIITKEHVRNDERRDALKKLRDEITEALRTKVDKRNALAKELGGIESDVSTALSQLASRRLDHIENNLDRLEEDQLRHELELEQSDKELSKEQQVQSKFYQQRIAQLKERQGQLVEELKHRNTPSAVLATLDAEIEQLQEVSKELLLKEFTEGRTSDIRVKVLQQAAVDTTISNDATVRERAIQ